MATRAIFYSLIFSALALFNSCSTELDVNAPYRETKVLYALLDPREPFQTVRVSKGFINEGRSAEDIARNSPDSSLYAPSILLVELIEISRTNQVRRTFVLKDTVTTKDSGLFYYPDQVIYKTPNFVMDSTLFYKVRVTNRHTGSISEATTPIVYGNFRIKEPFADALTDPIPLKFTTTKDTRFGIFKSLYAEVMQTNLYFTVRTYSDSITYTEEVWVWNSPGELTIAEETTSPAIGFIGGGSFWRFLEDQVARRGNAGVFGRQFMPSKMEVLAASIDYKKYRQAFNNYNSITQSLPIYTNVTNGLGVVASRNGRFFKADISNLTKDTLLVRVPQFKLIK